MEDSPPGKIYHQRSRKIAKSEIPNEISIRVEEKSEPFCKHCKVRLLDWTKDALVEKVLELTGGLSKPDHRPLEQSRDVESRRRITRPLPYKSGLQNIRETTPPRIADTRDYLGGGCDLSGDYRLGKGRNVLADDTEGEASDDDCI